MSLELEAADILLAARDEVMKPNGWCQGNIGPYRSLHGAVCGAGAIARVAAITGGAVLNSPFALPRTTVGVAVQAVIDLAGASIPHFNDEIAESASDVADLFDRAAAELKGRS